MLNDSLANVWWNFTTFTAGFYFATKVFDFLFKRVEKPTKNQLEAEITDYKNSINSTEIVLKNYEETIKTIRRELEEALKVLREENTGEETVKNKIKQLDELRRLWGCEMDELESFKYDLEKLEKRLEKFN